MSSTTSSDCESCECSRCTYSFEKNYNDYGQCMTNSHHVPIYATMAHPLIYYAQVLPPNRRQNSDQPKKDNPFKKAFKWYTQERKAICCENEVAPERSGFANWLDSKYCEYLRDSGQQPTSNEPRAPNTYDTNTCQCPKPTKTFRRFKSSWRKRTCPANDSGDVPEKCPDGSCEYILKPKELSRAASENCYHSPTSAGKSNVTIVSSQMPCNAKCSRRSQSLSDVSREKYVYYKHVETVPLTVQKGTYISCDCPKQQIEYAPLTKWKQGNEFLQEKVPEAVQVPSKQQDSRNQPEPPCTCQKEKLPAIVKTPSKEQDSMNQLVPHCACQKEKLPAIVKKPWNEQNSMNQLVPPCACQKENVTAIVKEQYSMNRPVAPCNCSQEKAPTILKEPSKEQYSMHQPVALCKCSQEKVPIAVKLPSYHEEAPQILEVQQENAPEVVKVLSSHKEELRVLEVQQEKTLEVVKVLSSQKEALQVLEVQQEKTPEVVSVPSKAQESTYELCCKCEKKNFSKVVQVPSGDQYPRNLPGSCCSCHVKKVPEVVQVPSQCRAVEESCQCPEKKVLPVCEETQYETAPTPLRSAQNHGPCCCNTCKPAAPPALQPLQPQIFCIPVKVQDRKISSPDICVAPSIQCVSPKKQKRVKQCTTVATQCGEGIQSKVSSQCQHEICVCGKDHRSSCNCYEERQLFDLKTIKRESHSTVAVNKETGEYSIMKEVAVVNKLPRCLTCASNGAAQTSDHSIRFENDGICSCPYPLYFKIVYADVAKIE